MSLLIGLGHQARTGKDLAVAHLLATFQGRFDVRRYAFADLLKEEFYDALREPYHEYWHTPMNQKGVPGYHYDALPHPPVPITTTTSAEKLSWIAEHKAELGPHLQLYGTELRRLQSDFYWVDALRKRIEADASQVALIADVRFPNEFMYCRSFGGYLVKVVREGYILNDGRDPTHYSEVALKDYQWDFTISVADGDVEALLSDALTVFEEILAREAAVTAPIECDFIARAVSL